MRCAEGQRYSHSRRRCVSKDKFHVPSRKPPTTNRPKQTNPLLQEFKAEQAKERQADLRSWFKENPLTARHTYAGGGFFPMTQLPLPQGMTRPQKYRLKRK